MVNVSFSGKRTALECASAADPETLERFSNEIAGAQRPTT